MVKKLVPIFISFVLLLFMMTWYQSTSPLINTAFAKEDVGESVIKITKIKKTEPSFETLESEVEESVDVLSPQVDEVFQFPYTPDVKVLLEEMTFVRLLSEEYARIDTVCAGNGLNNINPLLDETIILIPNAGDLSVDGSNVAIKLSPDGEFIFIPRVQGQRIRVPMDVGGKLTGWEVESLTLSEALQLMTAGKLVWTAKWFGPYGNGHGLPGHIAECDPRYIG